MDWISVFLIAVGLSMDAFAVAVCKGLCVKQQAWKPGLRLALCFGFFQFAMPMLGYFLGSALSGFTLKYGHWIAFALLAFIGAKMMIESRKPREETVCEPKIPLKELLLLGLATSIDAFAAGVSIALLGEPCFGPSVTIGLTTLTIAFFGFVFGGKIGSWLGRKAELLGGLVLLGLGIKILIEGLIR